MLIGVDLGTQQLGYAILGTQNVRICDRNGDFRKCQIKVESYHWQYGVLSSNKKTPLLRRQHLIEQFADVYKNKSVYPVVQPVIAIEDGYRGQFASAAVAIGEMKGCFIEFARSNDIMLLSYNASTVMKHIGVEQCKGKKREQLKDEIRKIVCDEYPEVANDAPQDAIDAIAVAWCCLLENK